MLKKRYLFLILIICLFAVSAVSAEETDNITNDLVVNDGDNGIYSIDDEKLSSNPDDDVLERQDIYINAPDVTKYYQGPERFVATISDYNGNPISNVDVYITVNDYTYSRTTDSNGQTSVGLNLNSGEYGIITECDGIRTYSNVIIEETITAYDFTKIYKNETQYYATFVDSYGNSLRNADVTFNINGVFYTRTTTENGVAKMNVNLNPGTYILTATNPSTGENKATSVTVLSSIVENHDLTKYYKNASQFTFRLLDDQGKPVGAGVNAEININGVFYTRTSDASGYVKMNINLNPGTYIATIQYRGLMMSNTVKVLSVLKAKDISMKYRDGTKFEATLLDGHGNPYPNQVVTFNINGVFYERVTDANGVAKLNINLQAGDYIITSSYNGLNAANTIKIAPDPNEMFYINLPFQDDIDMIVEKGKYKVHVYEWRVPTRCELDIILLDSNENIISKFDYDTYYYYNGQWKDMPVNEWGSNYHKWNFEPDAHITQVAVKLKYGSWY